MVKANLEFQVFVKPAGAVCNLGCSYCYYLDKEGLFQEGEPHRMPFDLLEAYIAQHLAAYPMPEVRFSWHGGEPTVLGLDYFRTIVSLQQKHRFPGQTIVNGMQTNGALLDDDWCRFLAGEEFVVGLSLDGPQHLHDLHRVTKDGRPTFERCLRGYKLLQKYAVSCDILCVVNARNVHSPLEVYRFFREIGATYVTFLPLVDPRPETGGGIGPLTVPSEAWGEFLCTVFDEWQEHDIGRIKVQVFEEAARTAFGQEHSLCIFRPICGDIPVVEHNGDFFSCDHFVDAAHLLGNIHETPLVELLESSGQRAFGQAKLETLPQYCRTCEVRDMCNGECPKNRILQTPDGESGLNYLCAGYRRFFNHCQPWIIEVGAEWHRQRLEAPDPDIQNKRDGSNTKPGRNDACPCGSGLKHKKCCGS
ncbi:MAG: anaerobic sulfatase maturase [Candidatus Aminicenantaceae bacterium]